MERIQKKEDQKQVAGRGMSPVQMAQVMGNQAAVVQMIIDWDSDEAWEIWGIFKNHCTENFVRRHICGVKWTGESPATVLPQGLITALIEALATRTVERGPGGDTVVFQNHHFEVNDRGIIYHYGGRTG